MKQPRIEWFADSTGVARERYGWQMDKGFMNGLVYLVSQYVYDSNTYGCKQSFALDPQGASCMAMMARCPHDSTSKDANAPMSIADFFSNLKPYGYCLESEELLGNVSPAIRGTSLFKSNFETQSGVTASFIDSYAAVPVPLRRGIHATAKNLWSGVTCSGFAQKRNVLSTRKISAPAYNYDCAIQTPETPGNDRTVKIPFAPRDIGIGAQCVKRNHIFFTGPNCTGEPLVLVSPTKANRYLGFFRTREPAAALVAGKDENMVTEPAAAFAPEYTIASLRTYKNDPGATALRKMVATAYYTEVLDRTIYYAYSNEVFRRTVKFLPLTTGGGTDVPYIRAYEDRAQIQSYYRDGNSDYTTFTGSTMDCVSGNIGLPDGLYGYVDQVEGSITRYSGVIFNHFRDEGKSPMTNPEKTALLRNVVNYRVHDESCPGTPDILKRYPMTRSSSRMVEPTPPEVSCLPAVPTPPFPLPPTVTGTVANNQFVDAAVTEWWSDSPQTDKSGFAQALLCHADETLVGMGRNDVNYGISTDPAVSPLVTGRFCVRYPLPREIRKDEAGNFLYSDVGAPLPEMAAVSRGVMAQAMICENDPLMMTRASVSAYTARIEQAGAPASFDFSARVPATSSTILKVMGDRDDANVAKVLAMTADPATDEFMNQLYPTDTAPLTIPMRSFWLGDPTAEDKIPKNYGLCGRLRSLPEHREYMMGPLTVPVRNYLMHMMNRNLDDIDPGEPPKCP